MMKKKRRKKIKTAEEQEQESIKSFLDMWLPGHVRIMPEYILQDSWYRAIWVVKSYPPVTNEQALLADLGQMSGVTLHVIAWEMNSAEEMKIVQNASNRSRMVVNSINDSQQNIQAQEDYKDIDALIRQLHRDKERLVNTSVFIEMSAETLDKLREKELEVQNILQPAAITFDRLYDRQEQGFLSVMPGGKDMFKGEFSRALPQISVANLYPFSYTGKADGHGFYIGRDRNGSFIFTDIDRKDATHVNSNVAILGNSGQGKSYLTKGLTINFAEAGKNIIILDPEQEYEDLIKNLGGTYLDLMEGKYMINVLEPKTFTRPDDGESVNSQDENYTRTYSTKGSLSQHISFLRDFFRIYKPDLQGRRLDVLEIILTDLYIKQYGISNDTVLSETGSNDFPTLHDLWRYAYEIYRNYKPDKYMYTKDDLREVLLALQSVCQGSQARYFDGHTNIQNSHILGFGMKGIMEADESLKNAMLFNVLSYMSDRLLNQKNTVAVLDEFYLFLASEVSVVYVRNCMKRVRKFDSSVVIASQNVDDFMQPEIASQTKPLLSIPAHKFLFNPGQVNVEEYRNLLQMELNEYRIIQNACRGLCLYMCGNERYSLQVNFPNYKTKLFGTAGGK